MNQGWKRMAKIQAPHDAARFGFAPRPSARVDKINASFRMHLRARVALAAAPDADAAETEPGMLGLTLPVVNPPATAMSE